MSVSDWGRHSKSCCKTLLGNMDVNTAWQISRGPANSSATGVWDVFCHTYISRAEEVAGCAIFVKQYLQPYFQEVPCNSSSSVFLNHYRTLPTKQRRGSKASGFRKQCHEGSTTSSHVMTPLVSCCSSTCSSKLYLYFSWNDCFAFVGDPSHSLVLDWRSRSTRRSIHMNEPK